MYIWPFCSIWGSILGVLGDNSSQACRATWDLLHLGGPLGICWELLGFDGICWDLVRFAGIAGLR